MILSRATTKPLPRLSKIAQLAEEPRFLPPESVDNFERLLISVTVKVKFDKDDVLNRLDEQLQELPTLIARNDELEQIRREQERQIVELKFQLEAPKSSGTYNNRGNAYKNLKQYERAIQDFDKAIELNPNYTTAKNKRERCLKAMGK